jgi:hypothetical protein
MVALRHDRKRKVRPSQEFLETVPLMNTFYRKGQKAPAFKRGMNGPADLTACTLWSTLSARLRPSPWGIMARRSTPRSSRLQSGEMSRLLHAGRYTAQT